MAQDFYAAFNVGEDNRHITSIDEDGVALAAIEALDAKLARKDAEIQSLPICSGRSPLQFASCDLGGSQCLSLRVRLGQWRSRRACGSAARHDGHPFASAAERRSVDVIIEG